jgi:hypothetical protein
MSRGHGVIINISSLAPFIFEFNPEGIETEKKINYAIAPNIGGAFKKKYFSGFDAEEVSFQLKCIDMDGPFGVIEEISYFKQLREPDPGITGGWGLTYGNINYPPPQVYFQFGISFVPLLWDVLDIKIRESHFHSGSVRGVLGIPKVCEIDITLSLVEDSALNKANQIAKKAQMYSASAKSILREAYHLADNRRKEKSGYPNVIPRSI